MSPATLVLATLPWLQPGTPDFDARLASLWEASSAKTPAAGRSVEERLESVLPFEAYRPGGVPEEEEGRRFAEELGRRLNAKLKAAKKPVDGFKEWKGFLEPPSVGPMHGVPAEAVAPAQSLLREHPDPPRRRAVFHYLDRPNFRIKRWYVGIERYVRAESGTEVLTLSVRPHLLEERSSWVVPYATTQEVWRRQPGGAWELRTMKRMPAPVPYELF